MRRLIVIVFLAIIVGATALLLTGYAFTPFLGSIEQSFTKATTCRISIERIRLAMNGDVIIKNVTLRMKEAPGTSISKIKISPRWMSLLKRKVELDRVQIKMGDGQLDARGNASISNRSIDLKIKTLNFPIDQVAGAFVSISSVVSVRHTGESTVAGDMNRWELESKGRIEHQGARLKSNPELTCRLYFDGDKGNIEAYLTGEKLKADIKMNLDKARQWGDGQFSIAMSDVDTFADLFPDLGRISGSVNADGRVYGSWRSPSASIRLSGQDFRYEAVTISNWRARIEHHPEKSNPLLLQLTASTATWTSDSGTQKKLSEAQFSWMGDFTKGGLGFRVLTVDGGQIKGEGPARRLPNDLAWRWNNLAYVSPQKQEWSAAPGGKIEFNTLGEIDLKDLQLGAEDASLSVKHFSFGGGKFSLDAVSHNFQLSQILGKPTELSGILSGEIHLSGPLEGPTGQFNFLISSASMGELSPLSAHATGEVHDALVTVKDAVIEGPTFPPVTLRGTLPWAWVIFEKSEQAMDITFKAGPMDPADFIQKIPNTEVKSGGTIEFGGRMAGPRGAIHLQGTLTAFVPSLQMSTIGLDASDATLDIEIKNQHLVIRKAEVKLGKGDLHVSGESVLPALQFDIRGENASLHVPRHLDIEADIDLKLRGTTAAPQLTGEIHVDQATYEANKKKKEEEKKETASPFLGWWDLLQVNVKTMWDNNVWYRDGLTKIETEADLEIMKDHGERHLRLSGQVMVLRGSYDAYGRDFVFKTGELTFTGSSDLDPMVNIQATHTMPDAFIELTITGTAQKPELHFISTPPMPEQDILAMLALGKAPGQSSFPLNEEDKTSAAADLAADVVSNYLTREIRSTGMNVLDLDVIRVAPSDKGKEWTVGRYWGSKLFMSYSYNPENSASQVLKAEYTIFPRWTLVGQSGAQSDNYLDLNFRLPVGKQR